MCLHINKFFAEPIEKTYIQSPFFLFFFFLVAVSSQSCLFLFKFYFDNLCCFSFFICYTTVILNYQSLEFIVEMRILAEMKIVGKNIFRGKKINKHTFFPMKIKMMDL